MPRHSLGYIPPPDGPFHQTRSGAAFLPWECELGPPLHAPPDFDLASLLKAAIQAEDRLYLDAICHTNDLQADTMRLPDASPCSDAQQPPHAIPRSCPGLANSGPPSLEAQLRAIAGPNTGALSARQSTPPVLPLRPHVAPCPPPSPLERPVVRPPSPLEPVAHPLPSEPDISPLRYEPIIGLTETPKRKRADSCPPSTSTSVTGTETSLTREVYHQRQRSKARRRRKRTAAVTFLSNPSVSADSNVYARPLKLVSKKRRAQASSIQIDSVSGTTPSVAAAGPASSSAITGPPNLTAFSLDMGLVPVSTTAFIGVCEPATNDDRKEWSVDQLVEQEGFQHVVWNGGDTRVILSSCGTNLVTLVGWPAGADDWNQVHEQASRRLQWMRDNFRFEPAQVQHRRGDFPAVATGISFGGGQTRPKNLNMSRHNAAVMDAVLQDPAIKRIANFGSAMLQTFHPRLHAEYSTVLQSLLDRDSELKPNFNNNVFAAATFNLGPKTVSFRHRDHQNVPYGMCAITALGRFNPSAGGHIILWPLRMVVQFPPAATILIPSAIMPHSNTILVGKDDVRQSFTQYSAGGLHRWAACGFQTQKAFRLQGKVLDMTGEERWRRGLSLLSKWSEY